MFKVCNPVGKLCTSKSAPPDPSFIVNAPAELPKTRICLILALAGPTTAALSP